MTFMTFMKLIIRKDVTERARPSQAECACKIPTTRVIFKIYSASYYRRNGRKAPICILFYSKAADECRLPSLNNQENIEEKLKLKRTRTNYYPKPGSPYYARGLN